MSGDEIRILIVDDEETVRSSIQWLLKRAGYKVATAADGQEALDKMGQFNMELVLLDIRMPGMSGIEVLKQLTNGWPDTCVIMITAVTDTQTAVETMKLGAYDYVTKPFNPDDLVLKVQRAIEKRDLQLKNKRYQIELQQNINEQAERMRVQFGELVNALAREHKLLYELSSQSNNGSSVLSRLPPELQGPIASVDEFKDALIRVIRNGRVLVER